jgi:hypothetical protein
MSPGVAGQLGSAQPHNRNACLACHAPRSEQWAMWAVQGAAALTQIHGIDCASCHVRRQRRYGPRELAATPHGKVEGLALFKRSEFCMKCHQFPPGEGTMLNGKPLENTYNEWRASRYAKTGQTCQSCHMPDGQHAFKGIHDPAMTRRGLKVQVTRTGEGFHVRASNAGAGHALPTYATPRITIEAETSEGERVKRASYVIQRRVHWDPQTGWRELSDTRLLPDQAINMRLPLAKQPNLTTADRQMLQTALEQGLNNKYTLYRFVCGPWDGREQACGEGNKR